MRVQRLRLTVTTFAVAAAVFAVACGGGDGDDDSTTEPTDTAEPTAEMTATEASGGGGDLFGGTEVGEFYTLNCSACHGANREGITGLGLPLLPDRLTEDDEFYRDTITNGRSGTVMPAWGDAGLSADEINALIAFIRTEP